MLLPFFVFCPAKAGLILYIILFFAVLDKGVLLLPPLTRSPCSPFCHLRDIFPRPGEVFLAEGGLGSAAKFMILPMALPLGELSNKVRLRGRACLPVFQKTQYFLKKGLHFAGQSVTIVKLIILIPYFTTGGASTMAKCECCGKGVTFGIKVSHSHRRSNRTWKPNVRRVKAVVEGSPKYVYACSRCLRAGKVTRAV